MKQENFFDTNEFKAARIICEKISNTRDIDYRELFGGINGCVFLAKSEEKRLIIKIYNGKTRSEKMRRFEHEWEFRIYLVENKIRNYPKIIGYNEEHGVAIMEYLEGEQIKSFSDIEIDEIAKDIGKLNRVRRGFNDLRDATEPLRDIEQFKNNIVDRVEMIKPNNKDTKITREMKEWFYDTIRNDISVEVKNEILDSRYNIWKSEYFGEYASYSDVGAHNMKRINGRLFYFDFEYAGKDDIAKCINDWTENPDSKLKENQKKKLKNSVINIFEDRDRTCEKRVSASKKIIQYKWVLIMMNKARYNKATIEDIHKIKNYCKQKGLVR